jgi:hypothetical protein
MKYGQQVILVVTVVALVGCAHVQQQFAAYDGPDKVFKGEGGTKVNNDGIEFWTTGSPPRNYRVLGILTDQRRDQRFSASNFAPDVAAEVKRVGGDAVVILDEAKEFVGTYSTGTATASTTDSATASGRSLYGQSNTTTFGSGTGIAIRNKITRLLVIKYVD